MGMAASQARLLCITARLHDVEYQAQAIQAAKIQLATQQDQAYREYNAALDATTLTINALNMKTGEKARVPATFNNLCSKNRLMGADGTQYALKDNQGRLIVTEEIENAYNGHDFNDAYEFAMYMIDGNAIGTPGADFSGNMEKAEEASFNGLNNESLNELHEKILDLLYEIAPDDAEEDITGIYDTNIVETYADKEQKEQYEKLINQYRTALYNQDAGFIMAEATQDSSYKEDFDNESFNYYVEIYKQIEESNGCVSIQDFDGFNGDAANDSDWLQAMVQSGQITISSIEKDQKTGDIDLEGAAVASESTLEYTPTSEIDKRALAKAEAEYEHKLKQIDKKDQKFDLDLSKLETERSALTTEYDSVKKVIQDNVERTFGIFS